MPELSTRTRSLLAWALAPTLACLAMLLQYVLDVPKAEMVTRESKADDKNDDKDDDDKDDDDSKAKAKTARRSYLARPDDHRQALREHWSQKPIASEPIDQKFRRHHESLLRTIVTRVRANVLGKRKPEPMQVRPTCKTLRCSLEVCTDAEILADMAKSLGEVTIDGDSLWYELREVETTRTPAKRQATKNHACRRWLVDFAIEGAAIGDLEFPGDTGE